MIIDEHELTPEEKWNRATIANNFIFYKVMRNNPDICKELLEILLEIEIERISPEEKKAEKRNAKKDNCRKLENEYVT